MLVELVFGTRKGGEARNNGVSGLLMEENIICDSKFFTDDLWLVRLKFEKRETKWVENLIVVTTCS